MAIKATSVIIEYAQLVANKNLQPLIEQAYGPKGYFTYIKVMVFFLSITYLDIHSKGKRLSLSSTN